MAEKVKLKFYRYQTNGQTYYDVLPQGNVQGKTEVTDLNEVNQAISQYSAKSDDWSQNYVSTLQKGLQDVQSGASPYVINDKGVLATQQEVAAQQQQQADIASGKAVNIGTKEAPLTLPKGTPNPKTVTYEQSLAGPAGQIPGVQPSAPIRGSGTYVEDLAKEYDQYGARKPGESLEDFSRRMASQPGKGITPTTTTPVTPSQTSPVYRDSSALRTADAKQKIEEFEKAYGLARPTPQDLFTNEDVTRLGTARTERASLEDEMASIMNDKLALDEEFRKFESLQGRGVTESARKGIVGEKATELQLRMDALNRRELVVETKLNNRNSTIRELMSLQGQEYTNAVSEYNTRFTQALQINNLLDKEQDEIKSNAKASLDTLDGAYQAQIKAGTLKFDQISPIQRAKLEEYELQAGIPQGSTMMVLQTMRPDEEKVYSGFNEKTGQFTLITKDAQDNTNVKQIQIAAPTGGTSTSGLSTNPLSILDVKRYQELYPDAGINAGDSEASAVAKIQKSNQPRDFSEQELRTAIQDDKINKVAYEDVISQIDSNTLIANKDIAKKVAGEVYGKKVSQPVYGKGNFANKTIDQRISQLKGVLGNMATKTYLQTQLIKDGYNNKDIFNATANVGEKVLDSISSFLFK